MKTYNLEEIKDLLNVDSSEYIEDDAQEQTYSIEEFDSAKTRVLKYIFYKKRTESEIRKKFAKTYSEELLEDVIGDLKEKKYINDDDYISRAVSEFVALKNLSQKELKYKLIAKGLKQNLIEEYFTQHYDQLAEYEINSANNIVQKKKNQLEPMEIKKFLMRKGYKSDTIKAVLE